MVVNVATEPIREGMSVKQASVRDRARPAGKRANPFTYPNPECWTVSVLAVRAGDDLTGADPLAHGTREQVNESADRLVTAFLRTPVVIPDSLQAADDAGLHGFLAATLRALANPATPANRMLTDDVRSHVIIAAALA